jgi:hypothetical protein
VSVQQSPLTFAQRVQAPRRSTSTAAPARRSAHPAVRRAPHQWAEAERLVYLTMAVLAVILGTVFVLLALL